MEEVKAAIDRVIMARLKELIKMKSALANAALEMEACTNNNNYLTCQVPLALQTYLLLIVPIGDCPLHDPRG